MNGEINKSECDFIGHENSNLRFKCKKCERIWLKPSLSSIANSISEINKKECKACMERKNIKSECDFMGIKDNQLSYKCKKCNKKWLKPVNKLIKKFPNIYRFCNENVNRFILLLRKGVYQLDNWEKFNETLIPDKEAFYSELNKEDVTDEGYAHAQKVWKVFEIKNLGEYHDLYVQSDTLWLANVFENFKDKCIEVYELDPAHFLSVPELAWQACLKKIGVKLVLLADNDVLMRIEKGIRGGICQAVYRHAKGNNKYMNDYDKDIESSCLEYLDANNLYGWAISQKLPADGFKWVEEDDLLKFNGSFIKNHDENSDKGY